MKKEVLENLIEKWEERIQASRERQPDTIEGKLARCRQVGISNGMARCVCDLRQLLQILG